MDLLVNEESIRHDIEQIDAEIERLEGQKATLTALLRSQRPTTATGRKPRLRGKNAYRNAVYDALTLKPQSIGAIAERAGSGASAALRHLTALREAGLAKELTGQTKHQRWVRTEVKIVPGKPVTPPVEAAAANAD